MQTTGARQQKRGKALFLQIRRPRGLGLRFAAGVALRGRCDAVPLVSLCSRAATCRMRDRRPGRTVRIERVAGLGMAWSGGWADAHGGPVGSGSRGICGCVRDVLVGVPGQAGLDEGARWAWRGRCWRWCWR
jgi:hypothetical protein